jgi:hypothetical protein
MRDIYSLNAHILSGEIYVPWMEDASIPTEQTDEN